MFFSNSCVLIVCLCYKIEKLIKITLSSENLILWNNIVNSNILSMEQFDFKKFSNFLH